MLLGGIRVNRELVKVMKMADDLGRIDFIIFVQDEASMFHIIELGFEGGLDRVGIIGAD